MKSVLDYTLLIGLIVSHLTQSDLDHTLPHIRLISSHLTEADRFGTLSSPHMPCTHMGLISTHLTKSGLHRTLHHMPCMRIILISSHLTKSGLDSTLPYVPCIQYMLDFQPFDKIRFGPYPPPHAMHTQDSSPAIWQNQVWTLPSPMCQAHISHISSHLTKSGLDSTLPHVPSTHFTHFQPFAGSLVSALKGFSLRWYSGFPLPIIPISNIIPSVKFFYIPFFPYPKPCLLLRITVTSGKTSSPAL